MKLTRRVKKGSNGQTLVTIPSDFAELMELEQVTELEFQDYKEDSRHRVREKERL